MKDAMIDMMVTMMPLMKPFMWVGVVFAIIGIAFVVANFVLKSDVHKVVVWSGRLVFAVSIFFILAQLAGYFLNMPPTINFGDSSKFEFILVSFWQIGVAFLIAGFIIKFAGGVKRTAA